MSAVLPAPTVTRRLALAWFSLGLTALGLSAMFAVILVVARTPFLGQGAGLFRTALVLHVNLAVLVWFLSMAAAIWILSGDIRGNVGWPAFWLAALGSAAMVASGFSQQALPLLANYVPLLDHELFMAGLASFALGIGIAAAAGLAVWHRRPPTTLHLAAGAAMMALAVAAVVLVTGFMAGTATPTGVQIGIDDRLWGVGHSLQFVHVLLLMGAWTALGEAALETTPRLRRLLPWLILGTLLPAAGGALLAMMHGPGTVEYRNGFTELMRWGSWPAPLLFAAGLAIGLLRVGRHRRLNADELGLALSLFLFAAGCLLGANIRGESLAVPAHYHGTVGAITLAYMLWLRRIGVDLGVASDARSLRLPSIYGLGIICLVAGLAVAGELGVPRKATHADLGVDSTAYFATMGAAGIGGFLALVAVAGYAVLTAAGLLEALSPRKPGARRDLRLPAIVLALTLVIGGGLLLDRMPGGNNEKLATEAHVQEMKLKEINTRFQQGLVMLHARQYDHALTAFHRVLQLSPAMPEAYVNAGFALIGMKRFREAHDFFEGATALRVRQVNAYYGLAIALEGMHELPAAIAAMETYLHLTKADDPYRRKAEAAIWEWREALRDKP
ncbi:MAG: hypothetical protein A3H93_13300 [Rhodocyclales bacterium RIFCSPLOWO2_02_FULL_63_24]|nr:MAG: hypothetical protein A3H93_13300 [Rhodocyclales bacterium RIFCSPLOWO2_02_FULL_63_24]